MSEKEKPSTRDGLRREVRGPPPGGLEEEIDQAAGNPALDFDSGIGSGVATPSVSTPGELSESEESFEIDQSCDCIGVPEVAVDKGVVGAWRFQVVYCSECMHRFGAAVTPVEDDKEDNRRAMSDE